MGFWLWKARNSLSGRGLYAWFAPKIVQWSDWLSGLGLNKSLASTKPVHKTQNWCRLRALLCELWTIAHLYWMTKQGDAVQG